MANKLLSKIVMITFVVLIVLGFTIPGFIGNQQQNYGEIVEPRLCQTDAECYLTCDDVPEPVLCSQNLCLKNSCEEYNPFPFQNEGFRVQLTIKVDDEEINLLNRTNENNYFVMFPDTVNLFTSGLPLGAILEKVNLALNAQCLFVGPVNYCRNLDFIVNGENNTLFSQYVPIGGDRIEISVES